jgi:hypothetical protein
MVTICRKEKKLLPLNLKAGVFKTTIGYFTIIFKSHSNGKSINEFSAGHRIAKNYDSVAMAISRYISKTKTTK